MTEPSELEARILETLRSNPLKVYRLSTLAKAMRMPRCAELDEALRNLQLRGIVEPTRVRAVMCIRLKAAPRLSLLGERRHDELKGYDAEMRRHWRMAEACGGRA